MITASDCYHRILCRLKMKNSTTNTIIWLWTVNKIDHRSLRRVVIDWAIRHKPVWHIIWYSIWVTWNELLYHTWLWNRRISIYVIVHPRSHMLTIWRKPQGTGNAYCEWVYVGGWVYVTCCNLFEEGMSVTWTERSIIARFMGPTWGPMLAIWTLLSVILYSTSQSGITYCLHWPHSWRMKKRRSKQKPQP